MPNIRPSSDLRNKYNEISLMCHEADDAVYITKNGCGDLAVMSIELYELLTKKSDLYAVLYKTIGYKKYKIRRPVNMPKPVFGNPCTGVCRIVVRRIKTHYTANVIKGRIFNTQNFNSESFQIINKIGIKIFYVTVEY